MKETVIRLMTLLAVEHQAVNLSQGFTDEPPIYDLVWGGVAAELAGLDEPAGRLESLTLREVLERRGGEVEEALDLPVKELLEVVRGPRDQLNHYSFPFGLPELRRAIADYTERLYGFRPDPDGRITVTLGATEALASTLRAVCEPGDGVLVMQPFHEMYPAQSKVVGLEPVYVSLREDSASGEWRLAEREFREAAARARVVILNSPHNPTGKVFTRGELELVAEVSRERDLLVITDEIYEHILYGDAVHFALAAFEGMEERTIVINSISKTGSATGWRIGWVISPERLTQPIRAIHDTVVMQAPTPLQKGAARLLEKEVGFFRKVREGFEPKREILVEGLREVGFRVGWPEGSYYLFADYRGVPKIGGMGPMEAAMYLIEDVGVASVPGDSFYVDGGGDRYLRFAFCRSPETLREAVGRLRALR